jgi:tetratricopeptide (TPR) repeat protein
VSDIPNRSFAIYYQPADTGGGFIPSLHSQEGNLSKPFFSACSILSLVFLVATTLAQTAPIIRLPITVQRQGAELVFSASPTVTGLRVALYDAQGTIVAESGSLSTSPLQWTTSAALPPGVYLGVFWLRGEGSAMKLLGRLELGATTQTLQSAEDYLRAAEPLDSPTRGTPKSRAAQRRAYEHGVKALPFFRLATKVLSEETRAHLLLVRAIQAKYGQFMLFSVAPPPLRKTKYSTQQKTTRLKQEDPQPTPEEKQEMLAAGKKAVATGKTCAEKNEALQWLAAIQSQLNQHDEQLTTLKQLASASCATTEVRAQSWYQIGVQCWQCCYELTMHYADVRRLVEEPFHYRTFTQAADQERFATCWQKGMSALEKALELQPNYAAALSYQSLLYRERQKTAASSDERRQAGATAERLAQQAAEMRRPSPAR